MSRQAPRQSPRELVERLRAEYVDADAVRHELRLEPLFTLDRDDIDPRRERINSYATALERVSPCSLAFDELRAAVGPGAGGEGPSPTRLAYFETALAYAGVLVDVTLRYAAIERRGVTRRVNRSVRDGVDVEALRRAGVAVLELARAVAAGDDLLASLDADAFAHPADTAARFRTLVGDSVETGDPEAVARLRERVEATRTREWTREDLLAFDPIPFERLLADCWRDYRNAAQTTRGSKDRGVDVVVETGQGDALLVQAKRYAPGNTVGIAEVQRAAGLLEEFPAQRAVLVTSSSFTKSAVESADEMDRVSLVDGERLCEWLTDSSLAPPLTVGGE